MKDPRMILYRTTHGCVVQHDGRCHAVPGDWDALFNREDLGAFLRGIARRSDPLRRAPAAGDLLAPVGGQEVWAAGVTYARSRTARMSESRKAGGSDFYDRIYHAARPELFFKATAHRTVGHRGTMHLRRDSRWIVPEPELTLAIDRRGRLVGYTIGNDLSCRDLEGENPLYLPQAKTFSACAALGPGILIARRALPRTTAISLDIRRRGRSVYRGATRLAEIRKPFRVLIDYLYRDNVFPSGCFLMTGTGVVPPGRFCLRRDDEVRISIAPIGTLVNRMD
jgi:2-dehydro-3-deoxy-D-arabinonate dehydratase